MIDSDRTEISGDLRDDRSTAHIAIERSKIKASRIEASSPVSVFKPHLTSNIICPNFSVSVHVCALSIEYDFVWGCRIFGIGSERFELSNTGDLSTVLKASPATPRHCSSHGLSIFTGDF